MCDCQTYINVRAGNHVYMYDYQHLKKFQTPATCLNAFKLFCTYHIYQCNVHVQNISTLFNSWCAYTCENNTQELMSTYIELYI